MNALHRSAFRHAPEEKSPEISKSRRLKAWEVINGRFVIWILTATIGALVAAVYANHQSCIREAGASVYSIKRVISELDYRRREIAKAVRGLNSMEELGPALKKVGYLYPEFKDAPMAALESDAALISIKSKIDPTIKQTVKLMFSRFAWRPNDTDYAALFVGLSPEGLNDAKLPEMKGFIDRFMILTNIMYSVNRQYRPVPHCSVKDDFLALFDVERPIVQLVHVPPQLPDGIELKVEPEPYGP